MEHAQSALLKSQSGASENSSSSENKHLFKTKQIEGTPFNILDKDGTFTLIMGNKLISPTMKSEENVIYWLKENMWSVITTLCIIINETINNQKK